MTPIEGAAFRRSKPRACSLDCDQGLVEAAEWGIAYGTALERKRAADIAANKYGGKWGLAIAAEIEKGEP